MRRTGQFAATGLLAVASVGMPLSFVPAQQQIAAHASIAAGDSSIRAAGHGIVLRYRDPHREPPVALHGMLMVLPPLAGRRPDASLGATILILLPEVADDAGGTAGAAGAGVVPLPVPRAPPLSRLEVTAMAATILGLSAACPFRKPHGFLCERDPYRGNRWHSPFRDSWRTPDKQVHLALSSLATESCAIATSHPWFCAAVIGIGGVGLEFTQGYVSLKDIGANLAGALPAAAFSWKFR